MTLVSDLELVLVLSILCRLGCSVSVVGRRLPIRRCVMAWILLDVSFLSRLLGILGGRLGVLGPSLLNVWNMVGADSLKLGRVRI